jgi:mRNA-degrading endonuclease RelE of RelBE toxin-antitoxin system
MKWEVVFHEEFNEEFKALDEGLQDELLAHAILVRDLAFLRAKSDRRAGKEKGHGKKS